MDLKETDMTKQLTLDNKGSKSPPGKQWVHIDEWKKKCSGILYQNGTPSIFHVSKVMLKILQARLQQYMNHELPDV